MTADTLDLDYDTIDEIDDADDDSLHVFIKDRTAGDYGWHWVYRDNLAEHGLHDGSIWDDRMTAACTCPNVVNP